MVDSKSGRIKIMRTAFSPAVTLMNRMSYTKKFMVLWLVLFVAITTIGYSLLVNLNHVIRHSQRQLDGLALIQPISKTIRLFQQHRGFSSALLGGNQTIRDRLAANEREAAEAFNAMEGRLPRDLATNENFRRIKANWESAHNDGLRWTMDENLTVHTSLIRQTRLFHAVIADEYALSRDTEIATFYLIDTIVNKLPDALEHFGQIRGYGTGILARKQITEQQKIKLHSTIVELDSALDELNINLGKVVRHNPAIRESVSAASETITDSARWATRLVESDILVGRFAMYPDTFLSMATAAIDNGYAQMYDTLLPTAESLIKARIKQAEKTLYLSISILLLLFLVAAYFLTGIYYAVTSSIQSLAHAARAFVNGDLSKRVQLNMNDELSQVGDIFNEMADGFSNLLEANRASENIIWKQANFDILTGLPNRRMFHDRMEQEIKKAHRAGLKVGLLFIDLDKFKEINDTLGHSTGDILLVEAARRISGCVRETDTVARLGGDEFTIILAELDNVGSIDRVTECILQELAKPFHLEGKVAYITGSIGITLYPDDAANMEDMIKNADQAMYAAKSNGHNCFEYFTHLMQQTAQTNLRLTNDLRGALAANQFRVHYQPIVELATGQIHKAEALVRWQHPEHGMVGPDQFIPLAEESGLIIGIGSWVFKETSQQIKRWMVLCDSALQVSVNVSPVQLHQPGNACETCVDYLRELGLSGQNIAIEITEGLLLETDEIINNRMLAFRNAGIQISIDDFGTGYSSLSYLKKFNVDYLKIDQSFVRNIETDANDMALSEAIIVMAHKLGLKVIAEGVETETQRRLLTTAGCDYAQGYLFSRPVPAEEFEVLFIRNARHCMPATFEKDALNIPAHSEHDETTDYSNELPKDGCQVTGCIKG